MYAFLHSYGNCTRTPASNYDISLNTPHSDLVGDEQYIPSTHMTHMTFFFGGDLSFHESNSSKLWFIRVLGIIIFIYIYIQLILYFFDDNIYKNKSIQQTCQNAVHR